MNNKGQTLVVFVIVLPILLMVFTLIIDLGFLYLEKKNIDSTLYDSTKYYLDNINDDSINDKIKNLLNKNINDIDDIKINENEEYVEIYVSKTRKSLYSIITHDTELSASYKGYKENKKIIKG